MSEGQLEEGFLLNDRYRILRTIGQGGMGTVYQAEHERLNAILAVKEIRGLQATGTAQQATLEQYESEARFLVRLTHPNLPKVTDAFVDHDRFYLVMDYVEGVTLEARFKELGGRPVDPLMVVEWGLQIADVLAYLHSQDPAIIFRDLKPSNVMVQPNGGIKLIDFGIARRFQPGADKDTALLGSVGYSPPEQFGRHQTDTRSDIYAFGATLHHLLTAKDPSLNPFKFPPASQINPAVPESLSKLLAQCLAMEADQRPANIHLVAAALISIRDQLEELRRNSSAHATAEKVYIPSTKITSAKLKEAERARPKRKQSGTFSSQRGRIGVIVGSLALVLGGVAYGLHAHSRVKPLPPPPPPPGPVNDVKKDPGPLPVPPYTGPAGPGGNIAPSSGGTDVPKHDDPPTLPVLDTNSVLCQGVFMGLTDDKKSRRFHVTGFIKGRKGSDGSVGVFFYTSDKAPLKAAVPPPSSYALTSGQLYTSHPIQIDSDPMTLNEFLDVPVEQFPAQDGVQFMCGIYIGRDLIGQSDMQQLIEPTTPSSVPDTSNQPHSRSSGLKFPVDRNL